MNKPNQEQQAREAWQKYTHSNQAKFWQYYEHLLANAKKEQQARKAAQPLPVAQVKLPPSPKEDPLMIGKKFILKIIALLILIFAYVSLQPEYHTGKSTLETLPYEENHLSRQEQWLDAMSTPAQRTDWEAFLERNDTSIPRENMANQFIRQRGLIDWSQAPTNMIEHLALYHLFLPGDTSIVVKKQAVGNDIKLTRHDSTLQGMPPSSSFIRARLILVYNNVPVIVKPDGYYIKSPYQTKATKVVKGGEQLLRLKIVVEQL
jgi:hypothetical protein